MYGYRKRNRRLERRRLDAEKRQTERDARSDRDQLARLEARGHGHCAEARALREALK